MKKSINTLLAALALVTAGCVSGTKQIGKIGNTNYYKVQARSFSGPNITMVVSEQGDGGPQNVEASAGGASLAHTTISAVGNVGAAAAFGLSLKPSTTRVNTSSDSEANSAAAQSGNSTSTGGTRINGNSANAPGHNR